MSGVVRILTASKPSCTSGETAISWNQVGIQGPKGDKGDQGDPGPQGPAGVANGITRAVHGEVKWDGTVIEGYGFHVSEQGCNGHCYTIVSFDPPFDPGPVTCVASPLMTPSGIYGPPHALLRVDSSSESEFAISSVSTLDLTGTANSTSFTFICVQLISNIL